MKSLNPILILLFCSWPLASQARVFSFQNNWVAAYFRGTGALSNLQDDAYADSSGGSTYYDGQVDYNFSGEIGFAFLLGEKFTVRTGFEGIQGQEQNRAGYQTTLGTQLMDVRSKVLAMNPNLTAELVFATGLNSRYFLFAGAGYSTVKIRNDYTMTDAGDTLYFGGVGAYDYTEASEGTAISSQFGVGYEMFAFDNVTFIFDVGYRYLRVAEFEHMDTVTTVNGPVIKNSPFLDNNGSKIELDMGGPFVGLNFRFYIPPLD